MVPSLGLLALAHAAASPVADYFVAPGGNDAWSGTLPTANQVGTDGPFATPARARVAVRASRKANPPKQAVTVLHRGGRYELAEPLTFTPDDSGTKASPLLFAAYTARRPSSRGARS